MDENYIKEKLEREKKVIFINLIEYKGKKYIKALKNEKDGISYIYYEIENNQIEEVQDENTISYLKAFYETGNDDKIY